MRHLFTAFMGSFLLALAPVTAAVSPLAVDLPETAAWIGQRVPFTIELRARGSFSGSASFDLPQVPGTLIVKIGNPVVGSKQLDGENWVVQSHEFALFSQQVGTLEIASFPVRFERREGFTGAAEAVQAETPVLKFQIERPPGSEDINFLVTTDSLELSESWEPEPGPARVGTVFKRSIVQRAREIPGMALAPVPDAAPDGIRVYSGRSGDQRQACPRGIPRGTPGNHHLSHRETRHYRAACPDLPMVESGAGETPIENPSSRHLRSRCACRCHLFWRSRAFQSPLGVATGIRRGHRPAGVPMARDFRGLAAILERVEPAPPGRRTPPATSLPPARRNGGV